MLSALQAGARRRPVPAAAAPRRADSALLRPRGHPAVRPVRGRDGRRLHGALPRSGHPGRVVHGRVVQVEPMKPELNPAMTWLIIPAQCRARCRSEVLKLT